MDYLKNVVRAVAKKVKYLEWNTPAGLIVRQQYKKQMKKMIRTNLYGAILKTTIQTDEDEKFDYQKQLNGICANFIHSMDACCLMSYISKCKENGINSIMSVHDCYATHATDTELSAKLLRESFVELYKKPILENFVEDIKSLVEEDIAMPAQPKTGNLNIESVLNSKYFFN